MVFFTCDACGASLKKNQVEKHYLHQCKRCTVLTCIDCHKDFPGDEYKGHTKCITEEEKYSAKGWQPKAGANKGAKKQQAWLEKLHELVKSVKIDPDVSALLDAIMTYDNIPRKKPKFCNFCKNVVGKRTSPATIDKTWQIFQQAQFSAKDEEEKKEKEEEKKNGKKRTLDENEEDEENCSSNNKKKKKPKLDDDEESEKKFDWLEAIEEVLQKKGQLKTKRLKKKVVEHYLQFHEGGSNKTRQQLEVKFDKKLQNKRFKVVKETVQLSTSRE